MSARPLRIVLADDQPIVRAGFRALLDAEPGLSVVGEATDGREAVELARNLAPDIVLMDIRMPEMDGLEATRRIVADADLGATRVLVLTTFELDDYVFGALRAGASGFLLKGGELADVLAAIRVVAGGEALLAPSVTRRLIEAFVGQSSSEPPAESSTDLTTLTPREHEVLALVAAGRSNREIAETLYLSPLTVKTHVSRVLSKLGARDRVQLVIMASRGELPERR